MKIFIFIMVAMVASGCDTGTVESFSEKETGELKRELFIECMDLAAKMPRQQDEDVGDIVSECNSYAYHTVNQYRR